MWLSVDPLASEAPGWTPYCFCFDNPVNIVDPTGLFEDDYMLDKETGKITLLRETDDNFDVLYNGDESKSIKVNDQDLLPQMTGEDNTQYKDPKYAADLSGHVGSTTNSKDAENVFKFSADNSKVEWSLQDYTDGSSAVSTAHDGSSTLVGTNNKTNTGKTVARDIHSHPGTTSKDYRPSDNDYSRAGIFKSKNPNARTYLYMPKQPIPMLEFLT